MSFTTWIIRETGLSLYDFRVLDLNGTSEKQVRDLFTQWLEEVDPIPSIVSAAIEAAADEGFDVCMA